MKGIITWVGTNSKRVKAEIEEVMRGMEPPPSQPEDVQPVTWEQAAEELEIPELELSQAKEMDV